MAKIIEGMDGIKVEGHRGTWYVVDTYYHMGSKVYEVESEIWGEDAAHLIISEEGKLILENVRNGRLDLREAFDSI